ncbi:MAG: endonuclease III [bacterium]|nr:MAG: endonuclease III [bacterium]
MEPKADWFPHGEREPRAVLQRIVPRIRKVVSAAENPSVNVIARRTRSPFKVLVSTVISARTKEDVTMEASRRLFARAKSARDIASMREREIADCIYPAGFYRSKAKTIRALARMILTDYGGNVPDRMEELLTLPGVGRKTANLVLTAGFGKPGICVDTHVHRISNRLGVVRTANPTETEFALRRILPRRYWIEINGLLVKFGRSVCTPLSPFCSTCTISDVCAQTGVTRMR